MVEDSRMTPRRSIEIRPIPRYRPTALVAALCLLGALFALQADRARAGGLDDSPDDRVLIVTTNMHEAFGVDDVRNHRDMKNYVDRLLTLVPYNPDILNLQEITGKPARYVAGRLSNATGDHYIVALSPGNDPWVQKGQTVTKSETAVLLNLTTMKKEDSGGYLTTTYKPQDAAPEQLREKKTQGYISVSERSTGVLYALTSAHFSLGSMMKNKSTAERYKGSWTKQINAKLNDRYGRDTLKIVGGDFNTGRCLGKDTIARCRFTPTWKSMHDAGYRSAVHLLTDDGAFDHIYTTAGIHRAKLDGKYNGKTAGPNEFYSDHQLRWALLSSDVTPPSAPTNVELSSSNPSRVRVTWDPSTNVGTGVAEYQIWRHGQDVTDFNLRKTTDQTGWTDTETFGNRTYYYQVVAVDSAHWTNRSGTKSIDL